MIRLCGKRSPCIGPHIKFCSIRHFCSLQYMLASKVLWLAVVLGPVVSVAELSGCVRLSSLASRCRFVFPLLSPIDCI